MNKFTLDFNSVGIKNIAEVGGKNASLGELISNLSSKGINIPDGFATTSAAYWEFIYRNKLKDPLRELFDKLDRKNFTNLKDIGSAARELILNAKIPDEIVEEIEQEYNKMCEKHESLLDVAVRSSATAEDLPSASFAGQHDSFLNVRNKENVLKACLKCFASLFNDRAIKYREDSGFDHLSIALSIGIQKMVRSDMGCSGVGFTLEPESGFRDIILLSGIWGLGENIVQGAVTPDEFYIFKPTFMNGKNGIISKKLGAKEKTMIYTDIVDHQEGKTIGNIETPKNKREEFVLNNEEINLLAQWCLIIEQHYKVPMDIEWAKDGITSDLFIVQARPETGRAKNEPYKIHEFKLKEKGKVIVHGNSIGSNISAGIARILSSPKESDKFKEGEVLVTDITNPDWDPIMKKASAIITNKGGRTSHASIVARELGVTAIVGTGNATEIIKDGQSVTVSCAEGKGGEVYNGILKWEVKKIDLRNTQMPKTQVMMILADPEKAFRLSFYPNNGVGLMRMEFIISDLIRIHPMALVKFDELKDLNAKVEIKELTKKYADKKEYFIDNLSQGIGTIAAAFYPKDVIVRMSDFKTNEYANLIGGKEFEPKEENPMLGFRGASRYYNERYREGFKLECEAMKRVRNEMGLTNVKLMIPFCRTVEEGKKVMSLMAEYGLKRGDNGLEIYVMAEIPSNVILVDEFAKIFDGFSIGSNDLTQLTLGIDRDSAIISELFDEKNEAPKQMMAKVIEGAKKAKSKIGLCGQAPSDFPEFAKFLVEQGIDSISFNPDAILKGIENILKAESTKLIKSRFDL
jgi:pyruvate,water dikinase